MKKLKKLLANLLIIAYAVIAIAVTILLLSYNDYHHSVVGGYTFLLLQDDELEEHGYPEGALVLVKEAKAKNINPGDHIFLYRKISTTQFEVKYAEVLLKDTSKGEYDVSYILEGSVVVNHEDVIGSTEDIVVVPHLGTILSILQSRYGYLFLIVVVSFIAFLYEIYELVMEIKYGEREDEEEDYEEDDEYYDDDEYDDEYYEEYEEEEEEPRKVAPKKKTTTAKKVTTTKSTTTPKKTATTTTRKATTTTAKKTTTRNTGTPTSAVRKTGATTTTRKSTTASTARKTSTTSSSKATSAKKTSTTKGTGAKTTTTKKKTTQAK